MVTLRPLCPKLPQWRMRPTIPANSGFGKFRPSSRLDPGEQTARASRVEPDSDRRANQSHDNAVAVSAPEYSSHRSPVDFRPADLGDDAAAAACHFSTRDLQREEFTQRSGNGTTIRPTAAPLMPSLTTTRGDTIAAVYSRCRSQRNANSPGTGILGASEDADDGTGNQAAPSSKVRRWQDLELRH